MSMTKKYIIITIITVCVVLFSYHIVNRKNYLVVETYRVDNGWGYKLTKDSKRIIDQPYMPCIEGNHPFPQESKALRTGELVMEKIKKHEYPAVTKNELITILKK